MLIIKKNHNFNFIMLYNKIFFAQNSFFNLVNKKISKKNLNFLYIVKILTRMGLMGPLNKKFGY